MSDDHRPKIATRRENQQSHQNAEGAGDRDPKRILVRMRCPEKRALHQASDDPRSAASTEQHGQSLHEESAEHEFLVEARPDRCIEDAQECEFQISLHLLELAQVAAKPRLF